MTFDFKIFMEIVGYIGTALVIFSMLMTSVLRLRLINTCGSIISMIYALASGAYPVVVLNASLAIINIFQLIRMRKSRISFTHVKVMPEDPSLAHFLALYDEDIKRYYPAYTNKDTPKGNSHLVFCGGELAGILIGHRDGETFSIGIDYATPKYRDLTVSPFLYESLKQDGIATLIATENREYLRKMGFSGEGTMLKTL